MNLIAQIVTEKRWLGWTLTLLMSIPPMLGLFGVRLQETQNVGWYDAEAKKLIDRVDESFRFSPGLIIMVRGENLFSPEANAALHNAVAALQDFQSVQRIMWMGSIPEVAVLRGEPVPILPPPESQPTQDELIAAREVLRQHPLVQNTFLSADAQNALLLIDLAKADDESEMKAYMDSPEIREIVVRELDGLDFEVRMTGHHALYELHDRILETDHIRIQVTAYILVSILAWIIFRDPCAIWIAASGPILGVIWTFGWLMLIGHQDNALAKIILPVMIMMIGYADGMHLVVSIRHRRGDGLSVRDSVFQSVLEVGPACLLTSLTTAIGFGSLMMSSSEMIHGFGFVCAIGVTVTFFAVIVTTPLMATSWVGRRMKNEPARDLVGHALQRLLPVIDFASTHARLITVAGIVVTVGGLLVSLQLIPDDRISDRVPQNSDEFRAMKFSDEKLGGIRDFVILIDFQEDVTRKELWSVVRECERIFEEEPIVSNPKSIRTMLTLFRGRNRQDQTVLANRLPEELRNLYYRPDLNTARVTGRVPDLMIAEFEPVFQRIDEQLLALQQQDPRFRLQLISSARSEGVVVKQIIVELMKSLAMAAVIIFAVLAVAFRSIRIGCVSIVPNLMPLAASGALRFVINDSLGIASACAFAICLGIAVDDTIHFLNHFQRERRAGRSARDANRATFRTVGSALVMTTVVMVAGLSSVLTANMPPHISFAAMAITTLITALIADLLVLPAVLSLFPGPNYAAAEFSNQPPQVSGQQASSSLDADEAPTSVQSMAGH